MITVGKRVGAFVAFVSVGLAYAQTTVQSVKNILENIPYQEETVRVHTLAALGEDAIPALCGALPEVDILSRCAIAAALAKIQNSKAIPALINLTHDVPEKYGLKSAAIEALAKFDDRNATTRLMEIMVDGLEFRDFRLAAAKGLLQHATVWDRQAVSDYLLDEKSVLVPTPDHPITSDDLSNWGTALIELGTEDSLRTVLPLASTGLHYTTGSHLLNRLAALDNPPDFVIQHFLDIACDPDEFYEIRIEMFNTLLDRPDKVFIENLRACFSTMIVPEELAKDSATRQSLVSLKQRIGAK